MAAFEGLRYLDSGYQWQYNPILRCYEGLPKGTYRIFAEPKPHTKKHDWYREIE